MDSTMMTPQSMGQASYFFQDIRKQRGHFQQHPAMQQMMYPAVPTLPSTPMYSRPNSACSQPHGPTMYSHAPGNMMTPMASPQPLAHKPTIMVETEFRDNDMYYPATPPLSTSGSVVGSPNSADVLQTPMNPMFSGLDGVDGLKDTFGPTSTFVVDWTNAASPPVSPVYLPQSQSPEHSFVATTNPANLISSSISACPSLSPSPSPYARSVSSEQDVDFCDPRNLTVSASSSLPAEFSSQTDEEVTSEKASQEPASVESQATFDFSTAIPDGLDSFDALADLEADADFSGLVHIDQVSAVGDCGRPRAATGSSVVSFGHGSFIGEDELSFHTSETFPFPALSATGSGVDSDSHRDKRTKKCESTCTKTAPKMSPEQPAEVEQDSTSSRAQSVESKCSETTAVANPAPANRRGRKQSLTEDPSKTFVCDLCNRRFRRQEHLKRHYRSLHTQEKPFECNECGKKFSRSDNLAQHARTHGSGAIVMGLIDDHDAHLYNTAVVGESFNSMSKVLFQVATEIPGSATDVSSLSSEEEEALGRKKRKRSD
ncbi:hypothetical protein jhhlp_007369 [Lomentospora prolificans]|uniref:C2H2-type transcription factor MSN2 n=1 Tax=Lomentospora prolificans TaxID=41688 RepID=A0A2N3N2G8_9PEZI|nr:hypothetical protein jhhlp_007369 [Lomentospora prolificans]